MKKISQILSENEKEVIELAKFVCECGLLGDCPRFKRIKCGFFFSQTNLINAVIENIEDMKPQKPYPNANNGYQDELDNEDKIEEKALQKVIDYLKEGIRV